MKVLRVEKKEDLFEVHTDDERAPTKYRTFSGEWYEFINNVYYKSLDLIEDPSIIEQAYVDWAVRSTNDVFY